MELCLKLALVLAALAATEGSPLLHIIARKADRNPGSHSLPSLLERHDDTPIPKNFDSRERWPHCKSIRKITDQGNCDSSWATAAAQVMSDRLCIATNGEFHTDISAQDILTCCTKCGNGCQGGYHGAAYHYWARRGVVTGGLYGSEEGCKPYELPDHAGGHPYRPTPSCVEQCREGHNKTWEESKTYGVQSVHTLPPISEFIQREIMTNGPVSCRFDMCEDFYDYKSGVFTHEKGIYVSSHTVKILGWGGEDREQYWIGANSWNTEWGENGFFKFSMNEGMEEECVVATPRN